jgi:alkanesulfonate monooxygenase SsuD/methylene tetrahydromethanopterin reductase-like flavin-dependent oxidoreductase (luciferase family)
MTRWILRLDMRSPAFARAPQELYAAGLEMAEWADRRGFAELMLSEHHGADDNYLPSPLVYGAALAARTQHLRLRVSALVLPLHDPLRIAEDVAVLDNISGGRAELVVVGGFLPEEFAMFGRSRKDRGTLVEEGVRVLENAWSGEPFAFRGRTVRVTPRPVQRPRPPILLGGSSAAAARRAARIADGFIPVVPEIYPIYLEECEKLGVDPGEPRSYGPPFLHVAEDPDEAWARIAPHALHESNSYAAGYARAGISGPFQAAENAEALRASGLYQVLTPDECVALAEALGEHGSLFVHPLMGGLDPDVAWTSLDLLASRVLPRLRNEPATRAPTA